MKERNKKLKVSVLMPSYNAARFLAESVSSILCQSYRDFELVVIDDGSSDGSDKILREFQAEDPRVQIIKNSTNKGIVFSLNRGLERCRGEYILRMDADDLSLPDRIQKQVDYMDKNCNVAVSGASVKYIDVEGKELGVNRSCKLDQTLLIGNPLLHPTVIIRSNLLKSNSLNYQERFRYAEDYFLWLQLSKVGDIGAISDVVLKYRISSQASRLRHLKEMLWATLKVKLAGISELKIRPSWIDLVRLVGEFFLLLLPKSLIMRIYMRLSFKNRSNINL